MPSFFAFCAGNGTDCIFDGVQRELWPSSYNCSQCCISKLEGKLLFVAHYMVHIFLIHCC